MSGPPGTVEDLRLLVEDVTFPQAREWKGGGAGGGARNSGDRMVESPPLPQNVGSGAAADYMTRELRRLLDSLERMSGRTVSEDDLRHSVAVFEENRALMRELHRIRAESPWIVPAHEAYLLLRAGGLMPKEEHPALLRHTLPGGPSRPPRPPGAR